MSSSRSIWRLLLLGVVLALAVLVVAGRGYLHFTNYTGLIVSPDLRVFRVLADGPSGKSGLQIGDQIVAFNDLPVRNLTDYFAAAQSPTAFGQQVPLEVRRETGTHRLTITVAHYPLLHSSLFGPALGVVLLAFGLYVFFKKSEDPNSGLYLALNACLFVLLSLSNHLLKQPCPPLLFLLWGVGLVFVVPVNLHFYLVFPEPKSFVKDRPWMLTGLYVVPLAFLTLLAQASFTAQAAMGKGLDCTHPYQKLQGLFVAYFIIGFISFVPCLASIIHSFLRAGSPERRKQVQIVLIGAITTLLLAIPAVGGLSYSLTNPDAAARWPSWLFSGLYGLIVLTTVFLPLSLAVAILKYRLWDVDTAMNRSLIYMGVSGALIALYFFIVGMIGWLFGRVTQPTSHLTVLVFTLTVALIAEPLRHLVKRAVDRTFNRETYEYRKTLTAFSREVVSIHRLEDLIRGLCATVSQALGVQNAQVVVKDILGSGDYRALATQGVTSDHVARVSLAGDNPIVRMVRDQEASFDPQELAASDDLDTQRKEPLAALGNGGASLIVPIRKGEALLGWISLGEKKSQTLYTTADRELLETLANQAAVAVINAMAFEEMASLYRDLQDKITKVEEQRSEIQSLQERVLSENRYLKEEIDSRREFDEIIGAGRGLGQVMTLVEKAAQSDATILVYGESGTGKELIARAIHQNSKRRDASFIRVNCAALSEGVLQSELFGHEKGAFTGAYERRIGRFELADGGTILLDEIGDISPATQILLLRVLQEREFERVGGTRTIQVNVRVIAATNRNLEEAVADGRFRRDLYYRLKVITINMPPLRERLVDLRELAIHFVNKYARKYGKPIQRIDEVVLERFRDYDWPGNVRELENVIERSVVLSKGASLTLDDIPTELHIVQAPASGVGKIDGSPLDAPHAQVISEIERKRLLQALELAKGNKSVAARSLGLKRSTLFNKLKRYGLLTEDGQG